MNVKYFIFIVFITISIHVKNCVAVIEVKTTNDLQTCTVKLDQCQLKGDHFIESPIPGPGGVIYLKGLKGESGIRGLQGPPGRKGEIGLKGPMGQKGEKGDDGSIGDQGDEGPDGAIGDKGPQGIEGISGPKGDRGSIGPYGDPGSDGICKKICPAVYHSPKTSRKSDLPLIKDGKLESPLETLCTTKFKGKSGVWMNPDNPFNVTCDEYGRTCIYPIEHDMDFIYKNAFNYESMDKPFWLSSYNLNKKRFKLVNFYKGMTSDQIEFLRNSSEVIQVIRYHCKNSYVVNNADTNLHLLSWNDVIIGPKPSEWNPTRYVVNLKNPCSKESRKDIWGQTDLNIIGSSKRLPITDFYVRDIRKEDQSFYVEHISLCFK